MELSDTVSTRYYWSSANKGPLTMGTIHTLGALGTAVERARMHGVPEEAFVHISSMGDLAATWGDDDNG